MTTQIMTSSHIGNGQRMPGMVTLFPADSVVERDDLAHVGDMLHMREAKRLARRTAKRAIRRARRLARQHH